MSFQLEDDQQVTLSVEAEDAAGNQVADAGTLAWTVSDDTILSLSATTGTSVTVAAVGKVGSATVTVTDQETGEQFIGSLAIDVVTGEVSQIVVTPGTPEAKAAPATS